MRLLAACSLGGAGHLNPLLPFLIDAQRRGEDVLVIGPPAIEEMVVRTGISFYAGGEPTEAEVANIRERLVKVTAAEASVLANRELFGRLATNAMLPATHELCNEWRPDLILRDPCEYASAVVAVELGIQCAQVAISSSAVEMGAISVAASELERHSPGLADELRRSPYLSRFPASLDPDMFTSTIRYREIDSRPREALPNWWSGSTDPLIYLTFGTVLGYMSVAGDIFRTAIDAVSRIEGVRILLTVGHQFDLSTLGEVPDNVHVESWVHQGDVLDSAALVICHGGSGTVFGSLAAGVPMIVIPMFADQFVNGHLVSEAGAGVVVESANRSASEARTLIGRADVSTIVHAIEQVLEERAFTTCAQRISQEMARGMTPKAAIDSLMTSPASPIQ